MPGLTNFQRSGQGENAFNFNSNQNGFSGIASSSRGRNPASVIGERTASQTGANITSFPSDLPPIKFNIIQAEFDTTISQAIGRLKSKGLIQLPVPLNMNDPHRVIYNDGYSYLGTLGNAATTGTSGFLGTGPTALQQLGSAFGQGIGAGVRALGFSLNSFRGVTIEQPQFKNHQLNWKFSPKTPSESIALQKILYNLKKSSALQFSQAGRFVFTFPDIFIPFYSNAPMMYKFKPCVLTSVDVDYVGGNEGPSFFGSTQAPESIVVQLSFLEIEYWVREDFAKDEVDGLPSTNPAGAWNWYGIDDQLGAVERAVRGTQQAADENLSSGNGQTINSSPFGGNQTP